MQYQTAKRILFIAKLIHIVTIPLLIFCLIGSYVSSDIQPRIFSVLLVGLQVVLIALEIFIYVRFCKRERIYANPILDKNKKSYEAYPYYAIDDYKAELEDVRKRYQLDANLHKNKLPYDSTPMFSSLYQYQTLQTGKIYYGCLIMANSYLFDTTTACNLMPAVFLFSTDEYYEAHPQDLLPLAEKLFENRENNFLKDELSYELNLPIEDELTEGRKVYASTILVYRGHLPLGYLSGRLLPVIVDPEANTSSFVVDVKYWTEHLIGNFAHKENKEKRITHRLQAFSCDPTLKVADYKKELEFIGEKYLPLLQKYQDESNETNENALFSEYIGPQICYAYVVDMREEFNDPFNENFDFPTVALYSNDEYYKENPWALKTVAERTFADPRNRLIAKQLINYRKREYHSVAIPLEFTGGKEVALTVVFVTRFALPQLFLSSRLIPVAVLSEVDKPIFVVPSDLWSEAFTSEFATSEDDIGAKVRKKYFLKTK